MIHYHGTPITPRSVAIEMLRRRHGLVSYAHPEQMGIVAEVCQSFVLDNGAFTYWKQGGSINVELYANWVKKWWKHPGFDFCLIPDVIGGTEAENEAMFASWFSVRMPLRDSRCVPVWHMHESIDRLKRLCRELPRVALGSSGQWATPGTADWWDRMGEAMDSIPRAGGYTGRTGVPVGRFPTPRACAGSGSQGTAFEYAKSGKVRNTLPDLPGAGSGM